MSGELYPIAGSKLYIGKVTSAKGEVVLADFTGETWTEIGGLATMGEIGDSQEIGEQSLINERRIRKYKTTLNAGNMENQFVPMILDPGQIKYKAAIQECRPYKFKVERGGDCAPQSTVTITIATPGVVTWNAHGLLAGQPVIFSTAGTLPSGLVAGTVYYVVSPLANSFSVAATAGGAPINTTGTQSGVHTASAPPAGMTEYFYGLATDGTRTGGSATDIFLQNWTIAIDSNIVIV